MKKLTSILALTAIVANLGVATVFAADKTGHQVIACNEQGSSSMTVSSMDQDGSTENGVNFVGKSTSWFTASNDNAPLQTGNFIKIALLDNRGYDNTEAECANGDAITIQSAGLNLAGDTAVAGDASKHLNLEINALGYTTADVEWTSSKYAPNVAVTDGEFAAVFNTLATHHDLTGGAAVALLGTSESFDGEMTLTLDNNDLKVIEPINPMAKGSYSGAITFTMN